MKLRKITTVSAIALAGIISMSSVTGVMMQNNYCYAEETSTENDGGTQLEIKDVSLQVGADETQRNITWYGESDNPSYVEIVKMPSGWTDESAFPESDAKKIRANQYINTEGLYSNKAVMKNLQENTTYLYRVGNSEQWSQTYTFTTAQLGEDESFNFLFVGDPQIGASHNTTNDTEGWDTTLTNSIAKFPQTSFILSAGDQINDKGTSEAEQYEGFFAPDEMQSYALAANEGNHDSGSEQYSEHYNIPNVSNLGNKSSTGQQSGDYYNMYNGVLFIALNSNNRSVSEHRAFIKQALEENSDATWKIVSFHHSIYSAASHATDDSILELRSMLPSIFSGLDIDAVLMGHDHCYTRTYMMDGNDPIIPEGHNVSEGETAASKVTDPEDGQVFYLTANSASGSKYYSYNNNSLTDFIAVKDQSNRPNITNVEVTENSLTFTTYYTDTEELEELDSFTIERTAQTKDTGTVSNTDNQTSKVTSASNVKVAKTSIKKIKAKKGKITVTAKKVSGNVKYRFAYKKVGTKKWKTVTVSNKKTTIKKLKSGKKYAVKVRAIKTVKGKTYKSGWSKVKKVKVK
ncbi:MAG: fibronectin type III domain-containing protein [Eubacterium sp.]|nr:fibronectin type III domain-containing protein [Eubacterium sp.]